jgi:predicted RNA-binding protein with RPS1 domain
MHRQYGGMKNLIHHSYILQRFVVYVTDEISREDLVEIWMITLTRNTCLS